MSEKFKALIVDKKDGQTEAAIRELRPDALPDGDVMVAVAYSSRN